MRFLVMGLAAAMLFPALAWAQTDPNAPAVDVQTQTIVIGQEEGEESTARPDPDLEIICRVVQVAGTRLARRRERICGTRTMWDQIGDQAADTVRGSGANTMPRGN